MSAEIIKLECKYLDFVHTCLKSEYFFTPVRVEPEESGFITVRCDRCGEVIWQGFIILDRPQKETI